MEITKFNQWPIPDEKKDPWYVDFVELLAQIDIGVYALQNTASNVIIPLGNVTWNGSFQQLSWSDDFLIPIIKSGTYLRVKYRVNSTERNISLQSGDRVVIVVPTTSSGEAVGYIDKISTPMNGNPTLFTLGFLYNNKFYANLPTVISSSF